MSRCTTFPTRLHVRPAKKVRQKSRECHNHKPQPFPDPKRKRKPTNLNKHKPNKRTESTKISSLFPKRGNRNTKRTEKHKNKMTHGKAYNKSPRRINHKATKSKVIVVVIRCFKLLVTHWVHCEDFHPTAQMRRLICIFTGYACIIVGNAVFRFILVLFCTENKTR